ncbi:hypothetical protein [Pseudoalteromonas sp. SA25]|nr:hypothetical protein [Pseudoalteromonas sp. SA25]
MGATKRMAELVLQGLAQERGLNTLLYGAHLVMCLVQVALLYHYLAVK